MKCLLWYNFRDNNLIFMKYSPIVVIPENESQNAIAIQELNNQIASETTRQPAKKEGFIILIN
jgi:hypothetical protein